MKIKTLQNIIGDEYIIQKSPYSGDLIIGTYFISQMIVVSNKTMEIKCDTIMRTKETSKRLNEICQKLEQLKQTNQLRDILDNNDKIENPITVYFYNDCTETVEETQVETFGYANTDVNGFLQHDNTHFKDQKVAIEYAIKNMEAGMKMNTRTIEDYSEKVANMAKENVKYYEKIRLLKLQLNDIS
jgi:hypothetical protein